MLVAPPLRSAAVRSLALWLLAPASLAVAAPPPRDAHPLLLAPAPRRPSPPRMGDGAPTSPSGIEQYGEVAILEGDDDTLSDDGAGGIGIVLSATRQDPVSIGRRFLANYPDEFDALVIFTTFSDNG